MDGYLLAHGAFHTIGDLTVDQMCSLVWHMMTRNAENEAEVAKFKARLWTPENPEDEIPPESPWSAENEMSAFAALAAETGQVTQPA